MEEGDEGGEGGSKHTLSEYVDLSDEWVQVNLAHFIASFI